MIKDNRSAYHRGKQW